MLHPQLWGSPAEQMRLCFSCIYDNERGVVWLQRTWRPSGKQNDDQKIVWYEGKFLGLSDIERTFFSSQIQPAWSHHSNSAQSLGLIQKVRSKRTIPRCSNTWKISTEAMFSRESTQWREGKCWANQWFQGRKCLQSLFPSCLKLPRSK